MNNETKAFELKLKADHLVDLWHDFCEKHTELYEFTCDEYMHLLASDIDKLNDVLNDKKDLLIFIEKLDAQRVETTEEILSLLDKKQEPKKLTALLSVLRENQLTEPAIQVEKLNLVLLDIIEKIQDQNKKNQVFLNKAIHSLKDLRESFNGKANYKTYSASGTTKSSQTF